jgi:cell division protease FtsH
MPLPEGDTNLYSREVFEDQIAFTMGGRAAEELVYNQLTTGASQDIQHATRLARAMVTQFGMSDVLGPRSYGASGGQVFLGRELGEQRDYSEFYAQEIDNEVKRILVDQYDRAKHILLGNRGKLDELADILIDQETLDRQSFEDFIDNNGRIGDLSAAPAHFDDND